nr:hypothetical protein [uncultured Draconibacterium sp.]
MRHLLLLRNVLIFAMLCCLGLSCERDEEDVIGGTVYEFIPRECKYIKAEHAYVKDNGETPSGDRSYSVEALTGEKKVKNSNYVLFLLTSNHSFPNIPENYDYVNLPHYEQETGDDLLIDEHDYEMERQIEAFLKRDRTLKSSSLLYTNLVDIEYRLTGVKNLNIYSTSSLLYNNPQGTNLNEHIKITGVSNGFVFDQNKQLIDLTNKDMGLEQYLGYSPIASAFMYLRFTSVPPEAPVETRFVIEMEMTGGEILRDTTETVTLLQ